MQAVALSPTQIVESIRSSWESFVLRDRRQGSKRPYVYASGWSPCTRQFVLEMTEGDKQPPWSAQQLANFRRGKDREVTLLSTLARLGPLNDPPFQVVGQEERFELKDRKGRVVIVGKTDATLDFGGGLRPKLEAKNWNPNLTAKIETFEDLFRSPWTRRGGYQLLSYLYGSGEPIGLLLLDKPGLPTLIPVELEAHLERMEDFLERAQIAQDHREAGTLPDFIRNADECRRCWCFGGICNPPTMSGPGAEIITDEEALAMLERREELKAAALEYDGLDAEIKARFHGVERGIAGKFLIEGRWGKHTTYEFPKDLKEAYKRVDLKGKFTLEISKLA